MFWIVGKNGLLAQAFQREFQKRDMRYVSSSHEECDLTNLVELEKFASKLSVKTIVNCSGYTAVDVAEKEKEKAFALNKQGVLHLAHLAKQMQAKLIHFSTDYVFNGQKKTPYLEIDPVDPMNVYGQSKYAGEQVLQEVLPQSLILRVSWLFSKEMPSGNFTKKMIDLLQNKEELEIVEDQIGKVTYAEDIVDAVLEMLDQSGLFHYANQGVVSRYEYAQEILALLQKLHVPTRCQCILPVPSSRFKTPALRPSYSALDTTKIEKILKKPIRHHREALQQCMESMLTQGGIYAC